MSKFSHLYHEKTVNILSGKTVLFQVTVSEIPTKAKTELQRENFSHVDTDVSGYGKKQAQREIQRRVSQAMQQIDPTELAIRDTLLGVRAWTLKDDDGNPAPVNYETWIELPDFITKQIEDAVEELNPESDETFPSGNGSKN